MIKNLISLLFLCTIIDGIQYARPGAQWALNGMDYSGLVWLDETQTKPTQAEIVAGISQCQTATNSRASLKAQAKQDVKDGTLTQVKRLQALLVLLDLDN